MDPQNYGLPQNQRILTQYLTFELEFYQEMNLGVTNEQTAQEHLQGSVFKAILLV